MDKLTSIEQSELFVLAMLDWDPTQMALILSALSCRWWDLHQRVDVICTAQRCSAMCQCRQVSSCRETDGRRLQVRLHGMLLQQIGDVLGVGDNTMWAQNWAVGDATVYWETECLLTFVCVWRFEFRLSDMTQTNWKLWSQWRTGWLVLTGVTGVSGVESHTEF